MFLISSMEEGGNTFGIGVCCSFTQERGNSLDSVILLYIIVTRGTSSTEHSLTSVLLRSPGAVE